MPPFLLAIARGNSLEELLYFFLPVVEAGRNEALRGHRVNLGVRENLLDIRLEFLGLASVVVMRS